MAFLLQADICRLPRDARQLLYIENPTKTVYNNSVTVPHCRTGNLQMKKKISEVYGEC